MHEAMIHAKIPLWDDGDELEIIADSKGARMNIIIDGTCEFRLEIDQHLRLSLKDHHSNKIIYRAKLYKEL